MDDFDLNVLKMILEEQRRTNKLLEILVGKNHEKNSISKDANDYIGKNVLVCSMNRDDALKFVREIANKNSGKTIEVLDTTITTSDLLLKITNDEKCANIIMDLSRQTADVKGVVTKMMTENMAEYIIDSGVNERKISFNIKKLNYLLIDKLKEYVSSDVLNAVDEILEN